LEFVVAALLVALAVLPSVANVPHGAAYLPATEHEFPTLTGVFLGRELFVIEAPSADRGPQWHCIPLEAVPPPLVGYSPASLRPSSFVSFSRPRRVFGPDDDRSLMALTMTAAPCGILPMKAPS